MSTRNCTVIREARDAKIHLFDREAHRSRSAAISCGARRRLCWRLWSATVLGVVSGAAFACSGLPVAVVCESTGAAGSAGTASCDAGPQGTGGASTQPECTRNADCKLIDDCCTCEALPSGDSAPACAISTCFASACTRFSVATASCIAGHCVLATSCDATQVTCATAKPNCATGEVAQVANSCWTGACIKASDCPTTSG